MNKQFPFQLTFNAILFCLSVLCLGSCASPKKIQYFQETEGQALESDISYDEPEIQTGDLIFINISATNAEAAIPFNLYESPIIGAAAAAKPQAYLVDTDGVINFPVLGKLNILGLTTKELTKNLEEQLKNYISDPVINIRFANFRVSVLGEVKNPGAIPVLNEHMSIIEAISIAGDLTIYGKRDDVLLIRTENGEKKHINLDLTRSDIINSPYFYVKQNDIIYVTPNKTRVNASSVGPNTSVIFSSISVLLAVIALII
ncbi:polysaccharide export protein [Tamlana agarivorans]|uniref:Polysaccharide export protein n=1 Tax=Pseudotamlana agarivorans TaxID=481183 RepID=A0ACC5U7N0_9FLAO|nr:polysaccharide biosynthesis/export family protein [Tamlana agarivorans]MBU2950254.1 polysaccharide export protein [Tamlana agarivorans]